MASVGDSEEKPIVGGADGACMRGMIPPLNGTTL
jgi:hypothetical protein